MTKYMLSTIGLALLGSAVFLGQATAGEAGCGGAGGCGTGCNCDTGCQAGCQCCPRCGCRLVPTCQVGCETKKTTEHEYCCQCKEICIPPITRFCDRGAGCGNCGGCCEGGNNGCQECCEGHCRIREVHKLMIHPKTKETCVKTCTVQWVCPNCSHCGGCEVKSGPAAAPAVPSLAPAPGMVPSAPSIAPPAPGNRLPPPPRTTGLALPSDVTMSQAGF